MDNWHQGEEECSRNLPILQEAFAENPYVLIEQYFDLLRVSLDLYNLSKKAEDDVWLVLKDEFPGVDKNTINLYIQIGHSGDFLETILFAGNGKTDTSIYVDEWGYSNYPLFANIDEVIEEVRRVVALIY